MSERQIQIRNCGQCPHNTFDDRTIKDHHGKNWCERLDREVGDDIPDNCPLPIFKTPSKPNLPADMEKGLLLNAFKLALERATSSDDITCNDIPKYVRIKNDYIYINNFSHYRYYLKYKSLEEDITLMEYNNLRNMMTSKKNKFMSEEKIKKINTEIQELVNFIH